MEGMSKLTETSSLVPSDFKRINQGLPVLFLLQTTYHSYTKHYWPAHFLCVYSYSFTYCYILNGGILQLGKICPVDVGGFVDALVVNS